MNTISLSSAQRDIIKRAGVPRSARKYEVSAPRSVPMPSLTTIAQYHGILGKKLKFKKRGQTPCATLRLSGNVFRILQSFHLILLFRSEVGKADDRVRMTSSETIVLVFGCLPSREIISGIEEFILPWARRWDTLSPSV